MGKLLVLAGLALLLQPGTATNIVCYCTNWSQYRPGVASYTPENVDPCLCTHIIHAFAGTADNQIQTIEWNDEQPRTENPAICWRLELWDPGVLQHCGHCREPPHLHPVGRPVSEEVQFDGLDVDWEYPRNRGSPADTQQLFTVLLKEMHEAFEQEAAQSNKPRLLISAAVSAGKGTIETAYQIPEMSKYMDLINVMTYDLRGSWEGFTGENSPLFAGPNDQGDYKFFNVVCSFLRGATEVWNAPQEVPYAYKGNQWIGYGNPKSFALKAEWLLKNGFGGAMVWAIDLDDFTGTFCGQGKYPLMKALKAALGISTPNCRVPTSTLGTTPAPIVTAAPGGGDSGFCAGKSDGLYPSPTSRQAFYNCVAGRTYAEACQAGLVFDASCFCCNWP